MRAIPYRFQREGTGPRHEAAEALETRDCPQPEAQDQRETALREPTLVVASSPSGPPTANCGTRSISDCATTRNQKMSCARRRGRFGVLGSGFEGRVRRFRVPGPTVARAASNDRSEPARWGTLTLPMGRAGRQQSAQGVLAEAELTKGDSAPLLRRGRGVSVAGRADRAHHERYPNGIAAASRSTSIALRKRPPVCASTRSKWPADASRSSAAT